mgnify:CR=1 FL=1
MAVTIALCAAAFLGALGFLWKELEEAPLIEDDEDDIGWWIWRV